MLTPRTTWRLPKLFSTLCTARKPGRFRSCGPPAPLGLLAALAVTAWARGGFGLVVGLVSAWTVGARIGASRAIGDASRTGLGTRPPTLSPRAVMSCARKSWPAALGAGADGTC